MIGGPLAGCPSRGPFTVCPTWPARIVAPTFREFHKGEYRFISFSAKKARGLMSRYIITNRLLDPEQIKGFDSEGYSFNPALSGPDQWVFTRG